MSDANAAREVNAHDVADGPRDARDSVACRCGAVPRVTEEDVKAVVEAYRRYKWPGGKWASVMVDTGVEGQPETLVVVSPASPPPASP